MKLTSICLFFLYCIPMYCSGQFPCTATLILSNHDKKVPVESFLTAMDLLKDWVSGYTTLSGNITLLFASDADSAYIRNEIKKIKKTLPRNFWTLPMGSETYYNEPLEDSMWAIQMFVKRLTPLRTKILSAYKITFEGNVVEHWGRPKIKKVQLILKKSELESLEDKIKISKEDRMQQQILEKAQEY